eukprot:556549_1
MALNAKDLLCKHVCSAQTTNDIIPLLRLIPLEAIQDAILDVIRGMDTNTVHEMKSKCLPITDILPDDLMQYIVSFSDSLCMKYINKAFNNFYNKNKALELKQRQHVIDKHVFNPTVKYEEHNKTWIIHPTRTHLNSEEIALGYTGPLHDLKAVHDAGESGDKLLFHDGHYETIDTEIENLCCDDLQFIGLGSDVVIKLYEDPLLDMLLNGQSVYFKNVKIEMSDTTDDGFRIEANSELSMEDCEIISFSHLDVCKTGRFNAKNCVFSGRKECNRDPIKVEHGSKVKIIGCTFTHHQKTCIVLHDRFDVGARCGFSDATCLECVGNTFKDNCGYPIAMDNVPVEFAQTLKSVITNNILEGYNGVNVKDTVDTANKIYEIE